MEARPPFPCSPQGCRDQGDIAPPASRRWVLHWTAWGLLVATPVLLRDRKPWVAGAWALSGILIGFFGPKADRRFWPSLRDWYLSRIPDDGRIERRISELTDEGPFDPEEAVRRLAEDEELNRLFAEERYWIAFAVPPLFGLRYGVFFGPLLGMLFGLDISLRISPSMGAWLGLIIGPVLVASVAGLALACVVEIDRELTFPGRLARRALLIGSPLLIVPATWHCFWRVSHRRERG